MVNNVSLISDTGRQKQPLIYYRFITDLLLIYYLGEQFPNEFMVSVSSLKSILMQYEAPFVN